MDIDNTASELHKELLEIYLDEFIDFSDAKRNKTNLKYDPMNLTLDACGNEEWFKKTKQSADILSMLSLEDDEEKAKEEKGIKILTSNKILTKIPVLFEQMKLEIIHINYKVNPCKY